MSVITDIIMVPGLSRYDQKAWSQFLAIGPYRPDDPRYREDSIVHKMNADAFMEAPAGNKWFTEAIYCGSWNYLDIAYVKEQLAAIEWSDPDWILILSTDTQAELEVIRAETINVEEWIKYGRERGWLRPEVLFKDTPERRAKILEEHDE